MKKNGFTLVELLAVIVILGLLATLAVTSAINVSTKLKTKMYCEKIALIESGAKQYGTDIIDSLTQTGVNLTVGDLVKQGVLKKDENTPGSSVIDPRDKSSMDNVKVRIYLKNKRAYAHVDVDAPFCGIEAVIDDIDKEVPVLTSLQIASNVAGYNSNQIQITIDARDNSDGLQMCLSTTGYMNNCMFETYKSTKKMNIAASLDGSVSTVYLTLKDIAGNKVNAKTQVYTVYKECSKTNKNYTAGYGSCSVSCGGGTQTRPYQMKDNYTSKICTTGNDAQACNTHSCDKPDDLEWSKNIACDVKKLQTTVDNGKFANYIEYQQFRNALYDCPGTSLRIMRSDKVQNILRKSSRYQLINTAGKDIARSCRETENSLCTESKYQPPAIYADNYVNNAYNGKVFVMNMSTNASFPSGFSPTNGANDCNPELASCEWFNSYGSFRFNDFYICLASPGISGYIQCTKRKWEQRTDGYGIAIGNYHPKLGAVTVRTSYEDVITSNGDWKSTTYRTYYTSGSVYIQIFKI